METNQSMGTKEKLFVASIEIFASKGYKAATVRGICQQAGASNINAVHYYYGNKAGLYREVLRTMFSTSDKRYEEEHGKSSEQKTPEMRLRDFIKAYCELCFRGGQTSNNMWKIFVSEMAQPSDIFDEVVEIYARTQDNHLCAIVKDYLGPQASQDTIRDCVLSVISQIVYYSFAEPLFTRLYPEHPGMEDYFEQIVSHVTRFSLGGLEAIRKTISSQ